MPMNRLYFSFFVVSGLCSVLYELVWPRLAMAQFGVTTTLVSIVLSTFMVGIGVGSWASASFWHRPGERKRVTRLPAKLVTSAVASPRKRAPRTRLTNTAQLSD